MDDASMLKHMYENFTIADLESLRKNRGFSLDEISSYEMFETVYLSEKGLASVFNSLSKEEIALLHLLKLKDEDVDISFFKKLYDASAKKENRWSYETYNEKYKNTFKKVRKQLIRKGVLVYYERKNYWGDTVKLERYRFGLPKELGEFIPLPFESMKILKVKGNGSTNPLRSKIKQIFDKKDSQINGKTGKYDIRISKGKLYVGKNKFRKKYLENWQISSWRNSIQLPKSEDKNMPQFSIITYAFSLLDENEWILPEDLDTLWKVYYGDNKEKINNENICEKGWKWSFLLKYTIKNKTYYHPADGEKIAVDPEQYLSVDDDSSVQIDLDKIPYESLEILNQISNIKITDSRLEITPDVISIGNTSVDIRSHPLTSWLRDNSSNFKKVLKTVEQRWGKQIIHDNLLIAKIADLSLLVKIQNSFSPDILIKLSNDFIAFPKGELPNIQHFIKKNGYVIKTIENTPGNKTER